MGDAADGRSDAPMDIALEMGTAMSSIPVETAGADPLEPMERNDNRNWTRRCVVPATKWAHEDQRSHMERPAQQQARELAQLHRTVAIMVNKLKKPTTLQVTQWQGMSLWLQETEKIRDAYHQDDLLWGKGITDMVTRAVAETERDQNMEQNADAEAGGLEASIQTDLTLRGGPEKPEEGQQLQPGRRLYSMQMPKPEQNPTPKLNPAPEPRPAPTPMLTTTSAPKGAISSELAPTRRWQTVPPQNQSNEAS